MISHGGAVVAAVVNFFLWYKLGLAKMNFYV